jgi:tetratricopeptide (TPR) repeat protein
MSDDELCLAEPDAEELRAAAALRDVLDGGVAPGEGALPELATVALLRSSGGAGSLGAERRAQLREQLLAALPQTARARQARATQRWKVGLPLACAAAAALVIGVRHGGERTPAAGGVSSTTGVEGSAARPDPTDPATAPDVFARGPAPNELKARGERPAPDQLTQAANEYRAKLLRRLQEPELGRAHTLLDRASSRADLETAQGVLIQLAAAPAGLEWSATDTRLVRQDVFCRLAEASLRLGRPEAALGWIRQGLELNGPPTPFLAQLSALQGQAREALGDASGAARSYLRALEINETLLEESLDGP